MRALSIRGRNLGRWLADELLPQRCLVCAQYSGAHAVCPTCIASLPGVSGRHTSGCPVCALPLPTTGNPALPCGRCLAHPPAYDATLACYAYAAPADALVQALKFGRRLASADFLARSLCHVAMTLDTPPTRVVPVPLAPARLAERGFNQALELARPVARSLGCRLDANSVTRLRHTTPQAGLHGQERRANMRAAFACSTRLDGEHVLVIDDVMTTGATLDALAQALKAQGAARVTNLVAARTLRHEDRGDSEGSGDTGVRFSPPG